MEIRAWFAYFAYIKEYWQCFFFSCHGQLSRKWCCFVNILEIFANSRYLNDSIDIDSSVYMEQASMQTRRAFTIVEISWKKWFIQIDDLWTISWTDKDPIESIETRPNYGFSTKTVFLRLLKWLNAKKEPKICLEPAIDSKNSENSQIINTNSSEIA